MRTWRSSRRAWLLLADAALLTRGAAPARAQASPASNVYAWGYNYYGELGDGTTANRTTAGAAAAPADAVAVAAALSTAWR